MLIASGSIPGEIEANPSKLAEVLLTDDVNRGLRSDISAGRGTMNSNGRLRRRGSWPNMRH
jgi:hypothetical protein